MQTILILLTLAVLGGGPDTPQGTDYTNADLGFKLTLPSDAWTLYDKSQGIAKVLVFSPYESMSQR